MTQLNPMKLQEYLEGMDYPMNRDDIVLRITNSGAPDDIKKAVMDLPPGTYYSPSEISEAAGEIVLM